MNELKTYLVDIFSGSSYEPLGIQSIASYLEKYNYYVECLLVRNKDVYGCLDKILSDASFIGFSISNINAEEVYKTIKYIKKTTPHILVFVGGVFATLCAEIIITACPEIDFVILGDGEIPLKILLDDYKMNGSIGEYEFVLSKNSITNKKAFIMQPDDFVKVSHKLLSSKELKNKYRARIYSSRGCCGNCSFCSTNYCTNTAIRWRGRPISAVFDEVLSVYRDYGITSFYINDSTLEDPGALGKERILEFCKYVKKQDIRFTFTSFSRAETFKDSDLYLLQEMKKAGFISVIIGIESMNSNDLVVYNKRATVEDNLRTIELLKKAGLNFEYGFIMLNPYSTTNSISQNIEFLKSQQCYQSSRYLSKLCVFYNTRIYFKLKKDGLLNKDYSYLNVDKYDFMDSDVHFISEIRDYICENEKFSYLENELVHFDEQYKCILFDKFGCNAPSCEVEPFQHIKEKLSELLFRYFKKAYLSPEETLKNKKVFIENFNKEMLDVYTEYEHVLHCLLRKDFVLNYFQKLRNRMINQSLVF